VTLPLLKTIDILLNRGCLNAVALRQDASFSSSLLACLKIEANKCTDVHRLLAIVSVSLGILCSRAEDRKVRAKTEEDLKGIYLLPTSADMSIFPLLYKDQ
jgi:hypothetical protein